MRGSCWKADFAPLVETFDPRLVYRGPGLEEALARLHFLIDHGGRAGLVLGAMGMGKSWLLNMFQRELSGCGPQVVRIGLAGIDATELLWQVTVQLGTGPAQGESSRRLWRRVGDRLAENRLLERPTVLLLDDADEATTEVYGYVIRLVAGAGAGGAGPACVLAADPGRLDLLPRRLVALASIRVDMPAWQPAETAAYLASIRGGSDRYGPTFQDDAGRRLHDLAGGVPRQVHQLANLAVLAAAARDLDQVDVSTVDAAFAELNVPDGRPPVALPGRTPTRS